ncbi:regulator [Paenibacillus polymyxa]|uniref:regulator n=1 Tax=Paenibacillus polymyxa TaxID=1406 RepID=UPI0039FC2E19
MPKEMRMSMGIDVGDPIEFYMDIETVFLSMRKYIGVACNLCNADEDLTYFKDSLLCKTCIQEFKENIGVSRTPAPMVKKPVHKGKRVNQSSQKLIQRLRELLHEHPHAKQGEYAQWLVCHKAVYRSLKSCCSLITLPKIRILTKKQTILCL